MLQQEANALYEAGFYGRALASLEGAKVRRELTVAEQVSRAELLLLTGSVEAAVTAATKFRKERRLSVIEQCRLADVLGHGAFRLGRLQAGLAEYQWGIELAAKHDALREECRLRVQLFRHQIRLVGPQQAAANVSLLRRMVHQSAEPKISVLFQLGLSELAARLGLLRRAHRHLETARALLPTVSDKATHAEFAATEMANAALESRLSDALRLGLQLAPIAEEVGSSSAQFAVANNLAHLLVAQLRFDEALQWINKGLDGRKFGGAAEVGLRDTLMQLRLLSGDLDAARSEAQTIDAMLANSDGRDSFLGLWYLLNRVKFLYRLDDAEAGLRIALDAVPRAQRMGDLALVERMKLLAAEGLARSGRTPEGIALVAGTVTGNPDPTPEMVAESSRVTGKLVAAQDPQAAAGYFERSARIFRLVGNLAAAAEAERDAADALVPVATGPADVPTRKPLFDRGAADLIDRLAGMAEVATHPVLLASEAFSLMADSGAVSQVTLYAISGAKQRQAISSYPLAEEHVDSTDDADRVRIVIENDHHATCEIVAIPHPHASARATILSIQKHVSSALRMARARQHEREQAALWPEHTPEQQLGLVCASERMLDLIKTVRRVAGSNLTVLLTGETGVGKELFARALHLASPRKGRTFLPFNCATVPKDMLDSQLFGFRRGSFTGALEHAPGIIRSAAGGTLFLDEVGELSMEAQPKLLRFLESGEVHPIGEPTPQQVDVRIVAATNKDLDKLVADGLFREDLYYRLNVLQIAIPPLRERREEIPALVELFLEKFGREMQKPQLRIADDTLEYLLLYGWPGNVRQLANEIRRVVALAEPGDVLLPSHLSPLIVAARRTVPVQPTEAVIRIDQPLDTAAEQLERVAIERALTACGGRNDEAAKLLGLSRKGLYLKRQRLKL